MPDRHGPLRSFTENSAAYSIEDFSDDQQSRLNDALQQVDADWLGTNGGSGMEPVDIGSIEIADVKSVSLGSVPPFGVLPIDSVRFTGETGPIVLKNVFGDIKVDTRESDDPLFIIGLHSPLVGSGAPDSRDSLIGVRPLPPGTYQDGSLPGEIPGVPIVPTPFTKVRPPDSPQGADKMPFDTPEQRGEDHPGVPPLLNAFRAALLETEDVTATLWHGPPPGIDPSGPILEGGSLISDTESLSFELPSEN